MVLLVDYWHSLAQSEVKTGSVQIQTHLEWERRKTLVTEGVELSTCLSTTREAI